IFFSMDGLIAFLITGIIFFFFVTPIEPLSDSMAQRRADEVGVSFGAIRSWGAVGFAVSSLLVGELLARIGIQYMIFPYFFFAFTALIVTFRLMYVKVDSQPIRLKDVSQLARHFPFFIFVILMIILLLTNNAIDNYIVLFIMAV